jgi:hypothetical protein
MASTSTIKLDNTMEWAKRLSFGRRSALGNYMEPALTSANTVLQTIVGAPFAWRWNRAVTGFIATAGQQDYTVTTWQASTAVKAGWLTVDDQGFSQMVQVAGTTGSSAPTWNHTPTGTTTDGTVTWKNLGAIGFPASQSLNFGWIETASVQDTTLTPAKWFEIPTKLCLGADSAQGRPRFISAQGDDGLGNITFRLMPIPDQAYPVAITIQQKPGLFTSINQTWSPIPDEYSRLYNWGFLTLMWMFADDARWLAANQKFIASLLGASEGLTETERNIFLNNWQAITGAPVAKMETQTQGVQARGV